MEQVPPLSKLAGGFARLEEMLLRKEWKRGGEVAEQAGRFRDAPPQLQPMIRHAYEHVCRKDAWEAFQKIPRKDCEVYDRQVIAAWNEPLFAHFAAARQERPRLAAARERVDVLDQLLALIAQAGEHLELDLERQIAHLAIRLPPG